MAHVSEKRLLDEASNQFLESRGFHCQAHCSSYSLWTMGGACVLRIDVTKTVRTETEIYLLLAQQYYDEGRERGKQDALEIIHRRLNEWVFPRPTVINPPTVSTGGLYS